MNLNRLDANVQELRNGDYGLSKMAPSLAQNSEKIEEQRVHALTKEEQAKLEEQIKKLNESIAASGRELRFKYNDDAEQLYVEVLDAKTQEVLSSLPPEFLIDLSVKMKELIGMFFDEKI
ncbi:hypothetical protein J1TS5_07640 [Paenibacillus macerans]|uniref:flagellar protein FlaG n=1 Tax=Paenibacillus macerans TaxID=44252 RepID=UPI001B20E910|nr:flagellar protein FlaG [Paenibacillus macerans]MBS5911267.1 flagellar protein FlaG [Paenibacillus macerans]GIP08594.1 hypothetical protein J1TS5_07640 [Paenibacillus macerans]